MLKKILLIAVVLAIAIIAVPAALADGYENGEGEGEEPLVFCLNNSTVMGGDNIVPLILWLDPEFGESQDPILVEQIAAAFRAFIKRDGGVGKFRFFYEDGSPASDFNSVSEGACSPAVVSLDRNFWLCYSKSQTDPAVYSRGTAIALYEAGYTVPFAVREPLSRTNIGNGVYLVCNLPAGYNVVAGTAISTGGGDVYTQPASPVAYMLGQMPLDYTRLAARG